MIEHLSHWHDFDPKDLNTYPEVNARLQVKYANGRLGEMDSLKLFFLDKFGTESQVVAWRYIRGKAIE